LVLVAKELKVSGPHLATNVQPREESNVILQRGQLVLPFACSLRAGASKHLQLVVTNDFNGLGSFYKTLSGECLELLLANHLHLPDSLDHCKTCNFLCVEDNQVHALCRGQSGPRFLP